jgi:hypothetical protein
VRRKADSDNGSSSVNDSSSLFMKYVRSKINNKVQVDNMPTQAVDIYKELIDSENSQYLREKGTKS